jgi:hypothetical protein
MTRELHFFTFFRALVCCVKCALPTDMATEHSDRCDDGGVNCVAFDNEDNYGGAGKIPIVPGCHVSMHTGIFLVLSIDVAQLCSCHILNFYVDYRLRWWNAQVPSCFRLQWNPTEVLA